MQEHENVSPEETAMHRAYNAANKPFPWQKAGKHRDALPTVGLPRRKVKRQQQLPPKVKAKLLAVIEQMKEDTETLKGMADANSTTSADLAGTGNPGVTDAGNSATGA